MLKLLVAEGNRKRGDVTHGLMCISLYPDMAVSSLCPPRAGQFPGEQEDLSPLLPELQGRAEWMPGVDLFLIVHFGIPFPCSHHTFFGFKESCMGNGY